MTKERNEYLIEALRYYLLSWENFQLASDIADKRLAKIIDMHIQKMDLAFCDLSVHLDWNIKQDLDKM